MRTRDEGNRSFFRILATAAACSAASLLTIAVPAHADISADSADDVCPTFADPCVVTEEVEVAPGSTLDFGTRTVHVTGGGQFSFGTASGTIEAGSFLADGDEPAIHSRGRAVSHSRSGVIEVKAFRSCSVADRQCMKDKQCDLGDCGSRRCAANPSRLCGKDVDCSNGTCSHKRCSLNLDLACTTNADCNTDTCAPGNTCENSGDEPFYCEEDSDCNLGTCSVGEGIIDLGGEGISGSSDFPAIVRMEAYGDITLSGDANLKGTNRNPGGTLSLRSRTGDINLFADVDCTGKPGGRLQLNAKGDAGLHGFVDCGGGFNDIVTVGSPLSSNRGVTVRARDIEVTDRIQVKGITDAPVLTPWMFGGYVHLVAKRNLRLDGSDLGGGPLVSTDGVGDFFVGTGYGGRQTYEARGNLVVTEGTRLDSNGGIDFGYGGVVEFGIDGETFFDGMVQAQVGGFEGFDATGGGFFLFGGGRTVFGENSEIDVFGARQSPGGHVLVRVSDDLVINGHFMNKGYEEGENTTFEFSACNLTVGGNGRIDNGAAGGSNIFEVHERMTVQDPGLVRSRFGSNIITYRTRDKKPRLNGDISPKPSKIEDSSLAPCEDTDITN